MIPLLDRVNLIRVGTYSTQVYTAHIRSLLFLVVYIACALSKNIPTNVTAISDYLPIYMVAEKSFLPPCPSSFISEKGILFIFILLEIWLGMGKIIVFSLYYYFLEFLKLLNLILHLKLNLNILFYKKKMLLDWDGKNK